MAVYQRVRAEVLGKWPASSTGSTAGAAKDGGEVAGPYRGRGTRGRDSGSARRGGADVEHDGASGGDGRSPLPAAGGSVRLAGDGAEVAVPHRGGGASGVGRNGLCRYVYSAYTHMGAREVDHRRQ